MATLTVKNEKKTDAGNEKNNEAKYKKNPAYTNSGVPVALTGDWTEAMNMKKAAAEALRAAYVPGANLLEATLDLATPTGRATAGIDPLKAAATAKTLEATMDRLARHVWEKGPMGIGTTKPGVSDA